MSDASILSIVANIKCNYQLIIIITITYNLHYRKQQKYKTKRPEKNYMHIAF